MTENKSKTPKFTFVDLFAGIGGFRIALQNIGGKCLGFSEIAPDAIKTYCKNFNESEKNNFGDITKLKELPKHDFMTAGVPCQSWSIAGKNLGFDDDRGQLWNDALYLLNKSRPKAFIFENVKGLSDPRNKNALDYIMNRIKEAGYYAKKYILNASDYGVPQSRVRIYIIGFREEIYFHRFSLPELCIEKTCLANILNDIEFSQTEITESNVILKNQQSLSCNEQGFNDYFLFNDLRGGETTIHSWDIKPTTERQKMICNLLLCNRRKPYYGPLDGNPLSLKHFQELDNSISQKELDELVHLGIFKKINYLYEISTFEKIESDDEKLLLSFSDNNILSIDKIKNQREIKKRKINIKEHLKKLEEKHILQCKETRYEFKNSKISTGLDGVNRIFLPSSKIYPTLVASDTNDFVSTVQIQASSIQEFKKKFLEEVYFPHNFRKITKVETCRIQGFPDDFQLPESRPRWMKLLGNSVSVIVIQKLAQQVVNTGVFGEEYKLLQNKRNDFQPTLFPKLFDEEYENAVNS